MRKIRVGPRIQSMQIVGRLRHLGITSTCLMVLLTLAAAQDLASFEKRITLKKLDNGLTVLICERPEAPVFSFYTHVDAGSVQDPLDKTGLAHVRAHGLQRH